MEIRWVESGSEAIQEAPWSHGNKKVIYGVRVTFLTCDGGYEDFAELHPACGGLCWNALASSRIP